MAQDWRERLRAGGHRLTPQRELVLAAVERLGHATPDEVLAEVRRTSDAINLSTVYRTLELLDELGLISHAHLTDRAPTYHAVSADEHFHLVCRGCGTVSGAPRARLEGLLAQLRTDPGFEADVGHLTIFGRCARCLAAEGSLPDASMRKTPLGDEAD